VYPRFYNEDGSLRVGAGHKAFDPDKIGRKRYRSVRVSLSRAIGRLEARGLITVYQGTISHWTGIALIEAMEGAR
jgi:hypothetical protein